MNGCANGIYWKINHPEFVNYPRVAIRNKKYCELSKLSQINIKSKILETLDITGLWANNQIYSSYNVYCIDYNRGKEYEIKIKDRKNINIR